MENNKIFYNYLLKILSITKIGLLFSKDPYSIKAYKEIEESSMQMLENFEDTNFDRNNYFKRDVYPTPNVSVRAVVINENKEVLMVQEKSDGGWALPGGWADLYDSPSEAVKREALEEAGIEIEIERLGGILSKIPMIDDIGVPEYAVFFACKVLKDFHTHDHEILDVRYFNINDLPPLSKKVSSKELHKILDAVINNKIIYD